MNYGAVAISALVSYRLGGLWEGTLFGKRGQQLLSVAETMPSALVIVAGPVSSQMISFVLLRQ